MNWRFETWRRLYVREEGTFAGLTYSARSLAGQLLKICDDRGRIQVRPGREIVDEVCFRLRMSRGERRLARGAWTELERDQHFVPIEDGVRIRNFLPAHGGSVAAPVPVEKLLIERGRDRLAASMVSRTGRDGVATEAPSRSESRVKYAKQADADPMHLAPSLPSLPTKTSGSGAEALSEPVDIRTGAEPDCGFHLSGRNTGRAAPGHVARTTCAECRHMAARSRPRRSHQTPPVEFSDVLTDLARQVAAGDAKKKGTT